MSSSLTTALTGKTRPRLRLRRDGVLTAVAIAVVFCAAACGGSGADSSASQSDGNADPAHLSAENSVAYADCMRAHGVPNFPDPGSGSSGGAGIDMASPTFRSAQAKCAKLSGLGVVKTTATEQQIRQAVQSSDCLRDHGYPDFPDPIVTSTPPAPPSEPPAQGPSGSGGSTFYGNGILFKVPGSINTSSPAFQKVAKACNSPLYVPGGDSG